MIAQLFETVGTTGLGTCLVFAVGVGVVAWVALGDGEGRG